MPDRLAYHASLMLFAFIAAYVAASLNRYSECKQIRVELALHDSGVELERSWTGAGFDVLLGDTNRLRQKLQCDVEVAWWDGAKAAFEVGTIWGIATLVRWGARAAARGGASLGERMGILRASEATVSLKRFVELPVRLVAALGVRGTAILVLAGVLLAIYTGGAGLFLDALALLPFELQIVLATLAGYLTLRVGIFLGYHLGYRPYRYVRQRRGG